MSRRTIFASFLALIAIALPVPAFAQDGLAFEVVEDRSQLERVVPASFYFAGLSGNTQRRNSAVGILGKGRHIVAGLVDVSGYSTEISGVYEGFFITDSKVNFGPEELDVGAYGIGFARDGKVNLFDLSGKKVLTVESTKDEKLRRPRPLMMKLDKDGIRLYKGKDYVLIRP